MNSSLKKVLSYCKSVQTHYITVLCCNIFFLYTAIFAAISTFLIILFNFFSWIYLPTLFDITVILYILITATHLISILTWRKPSLFSVVSLLEKSAKKPHPAIKPALEISTNRDGESENLKETIYNNALQALSTYPKKIPSIFKTRYFIATFIAIIILATAHFQSNPQLLRWWALPLQQLMGIEASITPGDLTIPYNKSVVLHCTPQKGKFPFVELILRKASGDEEPKKHIIMADSLGAFTFKTDSLKENIHYQFTLGNTSLQEHKITVIQKPILYSLKVSYIPPQYINSPAVNLREGTGSFTAYHGSIASFSVKSQNPLKHALFIKNNKDTITLKKDSLNYFTHTMQIDSSFKYSFAFTDSFNQQNDTLPEYFVSLIEDSKPTIRIVKPSAGKDLSIEQKEDIWVTAHDDISISKIRLYWRIPEDLTGGIKSRTVYNDKKIDKSLQIQYPWDLSKLGMYPGDTLYYWFTARDNFPFGKGHTVSSDTLFFRVPTISEIHKSIEEKQSAAAREMETVKEMQKSMKDKIDALKKSSQQKDKLSFKDKELLKDIKSGIKEQKDSLSSAIDKLQDAVEKMKKNDADKTILSKMDEVQKALDDLVKKYGDSLFVNKNLNEDITKEDLQKAMEKMSEVLPDMEKQLENTLKYLKRLEQDAERGLLAKEAMKLSEEQMKIASDQKKGAKDLKERQQNLSKQVDNLLKKVQKNYNNKPPQSAQQTKQLNQQMKQSMQNSKSSPPSSKKMNQMSGSLQQLSEKMQSQMMSAMSANMEKDKKLLLQIVESMVHINKWQDDLIRSGKLGDNREFTATEQQAILNAFRKRYGLLQDLKAVPPMMLMGILRTAQRTMKEMEKGILLLGNRQSDGKMHRNKANINTYAARILAILESLGNQSGQGQGQGQGQGNSGGMMSGLQRLSGKQSAINSLTSQMLRQMMSGGKPRQSGSEGKQGQSSKNGKQGGGEGQGGAAANAARQAAEKAQKELADQLKQLQEKHGKGADPALKKKVKELEEEARRISEMLKSPPPDIETRQDRFLARMLQTSLSLHKQDEGKEERKSKSASDVFADNGKKDTIQFDKVDKIYQIRLEALKGNYPESYRQEVQNYFDSLSIYFQNK